MSENTAPVTPVKEDEVPVEPAEIHVEKPAKDSVVDKPVDDKPAPRRTINWRSWIPWILLAILGVLFLIFVIFRPAPAPQNDNDRQNTLPTQSAPLVASPSWLESYTISPNNGENFSVTFGDWKGTGNDFYSKGDRKTPVTFVVNNTSQFDVVVNAHGANWTNGQIVKPGETKTFTEAAGDFRITLLKYANP